MLIFLIHKRKNKISLTHTHLQTHFVLTEWSTSPFRAQRSNINAIGPCELRHVGGKSWVCGQNFDRQIPAEGVHIHVLCPGPDGDLCLVLQDGGRFHGIPGRDEFKMQAPPQSHLTKERWGFRFSWQVIQKCLISASNFKKQRWIYTYCLEFTLKIHWRIYQSFSSKFYFF